MTDRSPVLTMPSPVTSVDHIHGNLLHSPPHCEIRRLFVKGKPEVCFSSPGYLALYINYKN